MNLTEMKLQLREEQKRLLSIEHQMRGNRSLYEGAVLLEDNDEAERYRRNMHDLLDIQLDGVASCSLLIRAMLSSDDFGGT